MTATDQNDQTLENTSDEGTVIAVAMPEPMPSDSDDIDDVDTLEVDATAGGGYGGNDDNGGHSVGDDDDDDDKDGGGSFNAVPPRNGEFPVRLSELVEWHHHPRFGSRKKGDHAAALTLSAADPEALRPIVVLPKEKGAYPIVDGRFLWLAIKAAHPGNKDVMVRCILFEGDEAAAVASVCDTALGVIGASAIEQAQALLSLKATNDVSQTAIAERYPHLTVSKVSNMLIAAKMKKAHPVLFDILIEPDRAPISYGCDFLTLQKSLPASAFQAILDRASDLIENGERFKPGDVFAALQVQRPGKAAADVAEPAAGDTGNIEVFGHDDQPVGTAVQKADGSNRLGLPAAAAIARMSLMEREAAADAFIALVRRHFGLEETA